MNTNILINKTVDRQSLIYFWYPIVLNDEALASHVTVFLLAGFDTTANAMALTAYLLALNPECQDKLLQEIDEQLEKHVSMRIDNKGGVIEIHFSGNYF